MKTQTKSKILAYITEHQKASPGELSSFLEITPQAVHRHLLTLVNDKLLEKRGAGPRTIYVLLKNF